MKIFLNRLLIIDGSYMLWRAIRNKGLEDLRTKTGLRSGGFYGFLRMFNSEIVRFPGFYPIICWDKGRSPRRLKVFPNYKHEADHNECPVVAGSEEDEVIKYYHDTRADLIDYFSKLSVPSLLIPGWEGDDLVYLLTKSCKECVVLSDDKDMIQLASKTCRVRRPMNDEMIGYATCDEHYKYPQYIWYKAIKGDPSDNISQVAPGVGGKSAEQIAKIMFDNGCKNDISEIQTFFENNLDKHKKMKAVYDNMDVFVRNLLLMDFKYVDEPESMQSIIESSIIPVLRSTRMTMFESYKYLHKYEVTSVDPGQVTLFTAPYSRRVLLSDIGE